MWLGIIAAIILIALCGYQVYGLVKDIKAKKENKNKTQNKDHVDSVSTDKGSEDIK